MAKFVFGGKELELQGKELKVGDKAPDFKVVANDLSEVTLADSKGKVRVISVVPSLDTGVCDKQTRQFNEEAAKLDNVEILTVSVDLPFAQKRWCGAAGIDKLKTVSDHRDLSFGEAYGVVVKEFRLLSRAVFVVDSNDEITYVQYVPTAAEEPDYNAAIEAAKNAK